MAATQQHSVAKTEVGFASTRQTDQHNIADTLDYSPVVQELNQTFASGKTRPLAWRRQQLEALVRACKENHEALTAAVRADLGGPKLRGVGEITAIDAAEYALAHLDEWAAPIKGTNNFLENPNGSVEAVPSPKGTVLLICPWNYPIGLCFHPLVAILAAGNTCLIKPSEVTPHCAKLLQQLVEKYLDPSAVRVIQGGVAETTALLRERYAHIVYTGNGDVARIILKAAARHLTPCTLELGGKSPVVVDSSANLKLAARRIAWGKWAVNCGQTCIAPDYILVDRKLQDALISELKTQLRAFFPQGAESSPDYGRIVNSRHVGRLQGILSRSPVASVEFGDLSRINADNCFIPPIILRDPSLNDAVLNEEIFGPILPIIAIDSIDEALQIVNQVCPRPLAFYQFAEDKAVQDRLLNESLSGAMVINGCNFEQYANESIPFGGIGDSGTGELNGEWGFRAVSHMRGVVRKSTTWPFSKMDLPPPPYTDDVYDNVVKLKYTGFVSPAVSKIIKVVGTGALVLAGVGMVRSRL